MTKDLKTILEQFIDLLMPELEAYEASIYIYLLRNSFIRDNALTIRIGKRTIAKNLIKGARGEKANYKHISDVLGRLEKKGCIKVGDINRGGTLYTVVLPEEVPCVIQKLATSEQADGIEDYFTDPEKRKELFDRDKWICCYCGERITTENATLDHFVPQQKGGKHTKENLRTSCLTCNSIKSGKTYEEATPFLLKNIQERRARRNS